MIYVFQKENHGCRGRLDYSGGKVDAGKGDPGDQFIIDLSSASSV